MEMNVTYLLQWKKYKNEGKIREAVEVAAKLFDDLLSAADDAKEVDLTGLDLDPELFFDLGDDYLNQEEYIKAFEVFDMGSQLFHGMEAKFQEKSILASGKLNLKDVNAVSYRATGEALMREKKYAEASEIFKQGITECGTKHKAFFEAKFNLANKLVVDEQVSVLFDEKKTKDEVEGKKKKKKKKKREKKPKCPSDCR